MVSNDAPNLTLGHTMLLLALLWTSLAPASEEALVFLDREKLAEIAIAAAHEEYPEIEPGDLVFDKPASITCLNSDPRAGPVPAVAEALAPCTAQILLSLKSTKVEVLFRDLDGHCRSARREENITVRVEMNGTAQVGARRWGDGVGTPDDCGEELDDLPVCQQNPLWNPDSCTDDGG